MLENHHASVVTLDFDARVAWPVYDWMGVCKAALESVTRYLARDLGPKQVRVNAIGAGPIRTMAAKGIPGFTLLADAWSKRAPSAGTSATRRWSPIALWLFSDWSRGVCGELIHVDGFHAMGTDLLSKEEQARLAAEDGWDAGASMGNPVILVVADDGPLVDALAADLGRRFGGDYRVLAERFSRRRPGRCWSGSRAARSRSPW